jgi:hypothetical protein
VAGPETGESPFFAPRDATGGGWDAQP